MDASKYKGIEVCEMGNSAKNIKLFGWVPCGGFGLPPLKKLNLAVAGALVDANVLVKSGWLLATGISIPRDDDGEEDIDMAKEEKHDGSSWLRLELAGNVFALALSDTVEDSGAGRFRSVVGKQLCDTYRNLSAKRLCWARWIWAWKRNRVTGELEEFNTSGDIFLPGIDEAVVRPVETAEENLRQQTEGYSFPTKYDGVAARALATYAAIVKDQHWRGGKHRAALMRLLAPFARAAFDDGKGLKFLSGIRRCDIFLDLASLAMDCEFGEAFLVLVWLALKDFPAPGDVPWKSDWRWIAREARRLQRWDLALVALGEHARCDILRCPSGWAGDLASLRGDAENVCLNWLNAGGTVRDERAFETFSRLVEAAKAASAMNGAKPDSWRCDALARIGRQMHEAALGDNFGDGFREIAERAGRPAGSTPEAILDYSVFREAAGGVMRLLLHHFPGPLTATVNGRRNIPESTPRKGMNHGDLWRWLGTDAAGRPLFPEEGVTRLFDALEDKSPYSAFVRGRGRLFGPDRGVVELFGVQTKRLALGIVFARADGAVEGLRVRAFPQIPSALVSPWTGHARFDNWAPWFDETCAYVKFKPLVGISLHAVYPFFVAECFQPQQCLYYKIAVAMFADEIAPLDGAGAHGSESQDDTELWRCAEPGVVAEETRQTVVEGLGAPAAMTVAIFDSLPFAVPVFHRAGLSFAKGGRIFAKGWLMADAVVNKGVSNILAILKGTAVYG